MDSMFLRTIVQHIRAGTRARCGVSILGTIHAGSVLEVLHRLQMGGLDLIRSQMRLIGLQRKPDGRRILTVYEGGGNPLWQGFSEPS